METLLLLLRDNPAAMQGFIGGAVASVLIQIITWRWQVVRRKHDT